MTAHTEKEATLLTSRANKSSTGLLTHPIEQILQLIVDLVRATFQQHKETFETRSESENRGIVDFVGDTIRDETEPDVLWCGSYPDKTDSVEMRVKQRGRSIQREWV
jgi:hypothetical protein